MPTDEQMRERFKETAVRALGFEAGDFDREESGEYVEYAAEAAWQMFRARDVEVRKLRELLAQVTEELAEEVTGNYKSRYGDPIHPAMELRYERDMGTVYEARAVLTGEPEGGGS